MSAVRQFGLLVVGSEILYGKRNDKHLPHVIQTLRARGMQLAWSRVVGDHRKRLVHELELTQLDSVPVFCFGGIGATPDDQTRQAAAEAFGACLVPHPDAVASIESQFGEAAYPNRIRMAELPEDSLLIPNPRNQIPGFTLYDHHFFPGIPSIAWPMLDWVLDHYYPQDAPLEVEKSVRVYHVRESELIPLMDELSADHAHAELFSLPHMAENDFIELGFRGGAPAVDAAFTDLVTALAARKLAFEHLQQGAATEALRTAL
jgi:molybdopterin-biosynthesis enzyme MoeA-like protein